MNKKSMIYQVGDNEHGLPVIDSNGLRTIKVDKAMFDSAKRALGEEGGKGNFREIKISLANDGKMKKTEYWLNSEGDVVGVSVADINRETVSDELRQGRGHARDVARSVLYGTSYREK